MADVKNIIKDTVNNLNHTQISKMPLSQLGLVVAYGSLLLMAGIPIFVGAFKSVKSHKSKLQRATGRSFQKISHFNAVLFPFLASLGIITLYILLKMFVKENLNTVITSYIYVLGVIFSTRILSPMIANILSHICSNETYHFKFSTGPADRKKKKIAFSFTFYNVITLVLCASLCLWYFFEKHWIASDLLGLIFAANGIEILLFNNVTTACIFLIGYISCDLLGLFYSDISNTVFRSFDAPLKLVFPQDILEKGLAANNFITLGLADIILPGIFIALMLRFDLTINHYTKKKTYFHSSFIGFILGFCITVFCVHYFRKEQPALSYLTPPCLILTFLVALINGDLKILFKYEDLPSELRKKRDSSSVGRTERTPRRSAADDKPKSPRGKTPTRRGRSKSRTRITPPATPPRRRK